jgi:hypothetical protein
MGRLLFRPWRIGSSAYSVEASRARKEARTNCASQFLEIDRVNPRNVE